MPKPCTYFRYQQKTPILPTNKTIMKTSILLISGLLTLIGLAGCQENERMLYEAKSAVYFNSPVEGDSLSYSFASGEKTEDVVNIPIRIIGASTKGPAPSLSTLTRHRQHKPAYITATCPKSSLFNRIQSMPTCLSLYLPSTWTTIRYRSFCICVAMKT
mgnify:CR=1 FL=1